MIKVIIADDHKIFREGILSLLSGVEEIAVIAEARNGRELLNLVKGLKPDIVLMDIEMPEKNGIEAAKEIALDYPNVRVIVLSMHKNSAFVKQMLQAGVSGYLPKDIGKEELIKAIRAVNSHGNYFTQELSNLVLLSIKNQETQPQITPRELEIIRLIVEQLTTEEIGEKLHISKHTVESHRQNILLKLELKNTAGLVRYAMENNIV